MGTAEIKAAVRKRDRYRCVVCGMTREQHLARYGRNLDVHRKHPGGHYTVRGSETVCRKCHASKPKSPPRYPRRDRGPLGQLSVWLPKPLLAAFESLRKEERRTKTAQAEIIMEDYIKRHGRLPPPSQES